MSIHSFKHLSNENQSVSFLHDEAVEKSKIKIVEIKLLQHPVLLRFLQSRKIDIDIATVFCKEVQYQINGRNYFALGFPNDAGGYELRNPQFKGCFPPKEITTFDRQTQTVHFFEGFMDYLSLLTMQTKQADVSAVVLNSITNLEKAVPFLSKHEKINAFLDNDEAENKRWENCKN